MTTGQTIESLVAKNKSLLEELTQCKVQYVNINKNSKMFSFIPEMGIEGLLLLIGARFYSLFCKSKYILLYI